MKKFTFLWVIYFVLITLLTLFIRKPVSAAPPSNFQTTLLVGSGLDTPTGFDIAPDGRIFILEQAGTVSILKNGQLLDQPFAEVLTVTTGDRGLLGIAFDPDFNTNHYVYFYYTGIDKLNRIVRFDASGDIGTDETVIYQFSSPSEWLHIGGTIAFGTDGKLYLSVGDNGAPDNAQDLSNLFGKILRFNKDGSIPSDNPYVGQAGKATEIWAYGLRNPFRFQVDSISGRIYVGDVGQDEWEEINLVSKGDNFGWPTCEGACSNPAFTDPFYAFEHHEEGVENHDSAVVAGPVYRESMFPADYVGDLFFGDYSKGFIKRLGLDIDGNYEGVYDFEPEAGTVVDIKIAPDGSLYYLTIYPGKLFRVTFSSANQPPTAVASADITQGESPLTVNFSSSGTSDPESDPIAYNWDFGDATSSTDPNPIKTYDAKGVYIAVLTVTDGINFSQAEEMVIQVGTPPTVAVTSPVDSSNYKAGDTIYYSAEGTDSDGNPLPDSAFETEVLFHHGIHFHPFLAPTEGGSGEFTIPDSGAESAANVWYEIKITGTDADGLFSTGVANIYPLTSLMTFDTSPSGLQVLIDGIPKSTPLTEEGVVGYKRELNPYVVQEIGGKIYQFDHWSNGRAIKHIIATPDSDTTYIAYFNEAPLFTGEYFNNMDLSGAPDLVRQDNKIDFLWDYGSPDPIINGDNFSGRWIKTQFFAAGKYRFTTTTDDGVRLYIDDNLIVDEWHDQSSITHKSDVDISGGVHEIKMEYFENSGIALAILSWDLSPNQPAEPIPSPTTDYQGQYWNTPGAGAQPDIPATPPDLLREDIEINFDWGWGSPDPVISPDHFVARWTKNAIFENATYRFNVTGDDGVRIYFDDVLILDKWIDQSPASYAVDIPVSAGSHEIIVEYYENSGIAVSKVSYAKVVATPGNGDGLLVTYYDNMDLTGPTKERIDSQINFDWGWGSPDPAFEGDTFSARWVGQILPEFSETYTFYATTDDGVKIWVDGQLIIDKWVDQSPTEWSGTINLVGGQKYDIVMEYYENGGIAQAKLYWESPTLPKELVPKDRLFSEGIDSFTGEYWNTPGSGVSPAIPATPPDIIRQDVGVDFDWGWGSPDPVISPDHFVVRWTKDEQFTAGDYTFTIQTDDGVRFYVDGVLIVDDWIDHSITTYTPTVTLTEDIHTLKMEYYENGGFAVSKLQY